MDTTEATELPTAVPSSGNDKTICSPLAKTPHSAISGLFLTITFLNFITINGAWHAASLGGRRKGPDYRT
ncbi:hypothetical protein E4U09_003369 [Claviceps aff. purpurea]|uniref:Uncharacterized protein n=1 Tax=Claviceps aff. purpurea TaxID=1967640 RepID=A0A9P7QGS7_9HYPO|nr:hypothetical protein E4U09_003369 [Claviceps aff. purpurea]